ncbi:hypothetical protein [Microcoleus sp. D2_18a_D3]|uniref:hypothetical protein n=1 Tax=Microcoleus sp. D2_18a_D3 TaxID=3055330 RepID=UPI002FCEFFAD
MTQENDITPVTTQENDITPVTTQENDNTSANSDILLMSLVQLAEDTEEFSGKLGVTLFVQGTIVTGLLISKESYLEALSDVLNHNISRTVEGKEAFKHFLSRFDTVSKNLSNNQDEESELNNQDKVNQVNNQDEQTEVTNIEFIHLEDAKFLVGNSLIPNDKGVYWRGILSRVDGFFIERFSTGN